MLKSNQYNISYLKIYKKIRTRHFTFLVFIKRFDLLPNLLLGTVFSKKEIKSSVRRNFCRRLVKNTFFANRDIFKGFMVVAVANKHAAYATDAMLWNSINYFLTEYMFL
jgi:ribonuclease P protein component